MYFISHAHSYYRYCLKLPHDDYTKLSPFFEVTKLSKDQPISPGPAITLFGGEDDEDEDPKHDYICKMTLPANCPIKGPIIVSDTLVKELYSFVFYRAIDITQDNLTLPYPQL